MFCLVCGAKIDDEAVFCPVCGSAVKISPPRPNEVRTSIKRENEKSEICPACGFVHDAGMMFCPRCGMRQSLYSKDGLNNEQTDIDGFEKHVTASGNIYDPIEQTEDTADDKQDPYGRQFDKYPSPQIRDPIRDFEKHGYADVSRHDFEKYPKHVSSPKRSLVGIFVVAAVVIAAVAIAVYFFM